MQRNLASISPNQAASLADKIPSPASISRFVTGQFRDINAAGREKAVQTEEEAAKRARICRENMRHFFSQEPPADCTATEDVADLAKTLRRELKALSARERRATTRSAKLRDITHALYALTSYRLRDLALSDPERLQKYISGEDRFFPFDTTSETITRQVYVGPIPDGEKEARDLLNGLSGNLRGEFGLYSSLLECGFVVKKENISWATGEVCPRGRVVRLWVNLDFVFGRVNSIMFPEPGMEPFWAIPGQPGPSFSEEQRGISTGDSYSPDKSGKENRTKSDTAVDNSTKSMPTIVGNISKEQGRTQNFPAGIAPQVGEKPEEKVTPAARAADLPPVRLLNHLEKEVNRVIFTPKRIENGQIRYNANRAMTGLPENELQAIRPGLLETLKASRLDGESWADTGGRVEQAIAYTSKRADASGRYIINPSVWTGLQGNGTLRATIQNFFDPTRTEMHLSKQVTPASHFQPDTANPLRNWLVWAEEQGVLPRFINAAINKNRRKWGADGEALVCQAIRYGYFRVQNGLKPANFGRYVIGICMNQMTTKSPAEMRADADRQEAIYRFPKTGQPTGKTGDLTTPPQPGSPAEWTAEKVIALAARDFPQRNCKMTPEMAGELAKLANQYPDGRPRTVNVATMVSWIDKRI